METYEGSKHYCHKNQRVLALEFVMCFSFQNQRVLVFELVKGHCAKLLDDSLRAGASWYKDRQDAPKHN